MFRLFRGYLAFRVASGKMERRQPKMFIVSPARCVSGHDKVKHVAAANVYRNILSIILQSQDVEWASPAVQRKLFQRFQAKFPVSLYWGVVH